jgi:hypothetical protein
MFRYFFVLFQKFNQDKYLAKLKENSQDYIYLVKIFDY